ncbi:MAG TPA: DNA polymerase III subunit beta [Candidatus Hydrogenedentes bacterium]|nr:DNA polymerase III subunit beta [Candidatus Hydrogenedentota bacterium]
MKIAIARQDLLDAVNKVKTVVPSKSALPILSHLLIETVDTGIRVSATDLKVSIQCVVDCDVRQPGGLTVSCQRLASILSELPDKEITLTLGESNVVELTCGRIHTKLFSMPSDQFPPIREFDVKPVSFKQGVLRSLFLKTSFAICTDQARYNLTGLLYEIVGGRLTVVATDGRRMSLCCEEEGVPDDLDVKVIIPAKMVNELQRLLGEDDPVEVFIDQSQAAFTFNSIRLVTALIEGNFPNYDMVIPKKHDKEAILDTVRFSEAMRRTRTMTNEKFNSVRFKLGGSMLTLKVVTPEVGEYEEDMEIQYDGENVEIAFNPDFILDILRHVNSEKVCLVLRDAMSPGVLKPYTEAPVDNYINVIMPIRI